MPHEIDEDHSANPPLLEARSVTMSFAVRARRSGRRARKAILTSVDRVSFQLFAGEVLAVVGESGSGKSTLAKVLSQLYRPTAGEVLLDGRTVRVRGTRAFRRYAHQVQIVFQDPFASLNPVRTIRQHLAEPLKIHRSIKGGVDALVEELLDRVKLSPPVRYIDKYPHELSGGQRQRVSIARALAANPRVLLADEPVSMLDVSIRLGVLNLLRELKAELDLGILYITHDIASARHFADRVMVMYAGQIVESGASEEVTKRPLHPYTRLLIGSAPDPALVTRDAAADRALSVPADPPNLTDPPSGCRFHPRCPFATEKCSVEVPPLVEISSGRAVACWAFSADRSALANPSVPPVNEETSAVETPLRREYIVPTGPTRRVSEQA